MISGVCGNAVGIIVKGLGAASGRPNRARIALGVVWIAALLLAAVPAAALKGPETGQVIGTGDGRIHIIPSLSAPSVKNGGRITVQSVVKAVNGVKKVEARIEPEAGPNSGSDILAALRSGIIPGQPLATLDLKPAPMKLGGVNASGTTGMWQAEWDAAGLAEGYYRVAITVTDRTGHSYTDRSLVFSDPIAGNNTVGSTAYPMRLMDSLTLPEHEGGPTCAVIDTANGYAYFGATFIVVKVALGSGSNPPTWVGAVQMNDITQGPLWCAVIDPDNGHAYFGSGTSPARVFKLALGAGNTLPEWIGSLTLNSGENDLRCGAIDTENGYAYFGTYTFPGRVVKVALGSGDELPTRVGAVTLEAGEDALQSCAIDATDGYLYFATGDYPGRVVKVAVGSGSSLPSRVGTLTLEAAEFYPYATLVDSANGYAYFATRTQPGRVVKVALGEGDALPTRVGAVTLDAGEDQLASGVIDTANGYAYFGTSPGTATAKVVKVALGSGTNPPTRVGTLTMDPVETQLHFAVIDAANGYAYFGPWGSPGRVAKLAVGSGPELPTRVGTLTLQPGDSFVCTGVVDAANGYAYLGTDKTPGHVVKVALGNGLNPLTRVGHVQLNTGENHLISGVIDTTNGYAYFGTDTSPGQVVKVALGSGSTAPTRVGAVTLDPGEDTLRSGAIDAANGYAYFGTGTSPGIVVKVALGSGSNPPTRVGAVTLNAGENDLRAGVIDVTNNYAYFGTYTTPGIVVKVELGAGSAVPARVDALSLNSGEDYISCGVADAANGYAYFGTDTTQAGRVVKVAMTTGSNPPTRVNALTLNLGESYLLSAAADTASGNAYFGTYWGSVIKVALGSGANAPSRVDAISLNVGRELRSAAVDPTNGCAYFATYSTRPDIVVRVGLSQNGYLKCTQFAMPESGVAQSVSFYSHAAAGNFHLALYDDSPNPALLWESPSIANTAAGGWLTVPISSGVPPTLTLPAGTYWLGWQVDTAAPVASYTAGSPGDGLFVPVEYGACPASLEAGTSTAPTVSDELWSEYITYEALPAEPSNPGATAIGTNTIAWTWQDNSDDETGFKVYDDAGAGPPATLRTTTDPDIEQWQHNGLSVNTQYAFQVAATNAVGDSGMTTNYTAWTLAATPVAPIVGNPAGHALDVAIGSGDGNPSSTEYAIQVAPAVGGNSWVQADGSLGATALHRTAAAWASTTVTGLADLTPYSFTATARNGAGVVTAPGPLANGTTLDGTGPTGSIIINDHAPYAVSTSVTLTLSAGDGAGSGVSQMQFSNNNAVWSGWESYATTKSWTLTAGDGVKAVYVQYRDALNNVSTATISDGITLDQTPPVITLAGANPMDVERNEEYVEPGATALDAISGDCSLLLVIDASAVNTAAAGEYLVTYDVTDAAGNPSHAERVVRVAVQVPLAPATALMLGAILAVLGLYTVSRGWGRPGKRSKPSSTGA